MYLSAHSYYSLRYGVISPGELVDLAQKNRLSSFALTDISNTSGIIEFVKACKEKNIKPIGGMDFRKDDEWLYTILAKNNEGFRQINTFLSEHTLNKKKLPDYPPFLSETFVLYPLNKKRPDEMEEHEFIAVLPYETNQLISKDYENYKHKYVLLNPVTFTNTFQQELHRHLQAINHNTLLTKVSDRWLASSNEQFHTSEELSHICRDHPRLLENAKWISEQCKLDFDHSVKNKASFSSGKEEDKELLREFTHEGLEKRYGSDNEEARNRVEKELRIIDELGFSAYFLITHDIIRFSMNQGFHHVGRGSGANSVVAYCLYITDVDPIELNLYFERFINPKRTSPPDFDIDYSWKERDAVLDYIFDKYGTAHTALLGTISTFRGKSIIRELCKVYGLPREEIDSIIAKPSNYVNQDETIDRIFRLAKKLENFPNLRSIHAGGVLISEKPVTQYTALDLPPKGYPTTQWDMYSAEDIGFEKLDILSQRGIGHIKDAAEIIRENHGKNVEIHNTDKIKEDPKAKALLKSGETTGCFYIESPAMRGLLKKLKCSDYVTLVAASSIIRPGVAKSGMMKEYIRRFHEPDKINYIHPVMKEQLAETYGVMVYQEDVLKVCHHFAGLDMADADILRRAMSGKYRSKKEFQRIEDKFFSNCREKGYDESITKEVWRQIESFAGYSFSKAHSASYAMESFQSLYLKAYYPVEFLTAVINNFGGFYHTWVYVNEANRYGASIELPCVNKSEYLTSTDSRNVFLGFIHLKDMEKKTVNKFLTERRRNGKFRSLEDFIDRTAILKEQLIILIRTGAFRFTGKSKKELLWDAHLLTGHKPKVTSHLKLFQTDTKKYELPELSDTEIEHAYDEIELLGFPVTLTYFDLLKTTYRGEIKARNLMDHVGKTVKMAGTLVTIKYVRTVRKEIMNFAAFLDPEGIFFDTVHFPDSLKKYPFQGHGVYLILGKVVQEFGFPSLEVQKMAKLPLKPNPQSE
jgi:DNA-directed DNA polymerase III PolC